MFHFFKPNDPYYYRKRLENAISFTMLATIMLAVLLTVLLIAGCSRPPDPLAQMMAAHNRGEIACVRHGVLATGHACKKDGTAAND
jgi:hypothetical protein